MKRIILSILILIGTNVLIQAQAQEDTICRVRNRYLLNGQALTPKQMLTMMQNYPDAFSAMKMAKTNYDASMVFGYIGGFLVGYPLGTAAAGGKPEWTMAAIGGVFILIALPLNFAYNKNAKTAVRLYNSKIKESSDHNVKIDFGFTRSGIGLICRF